MTQHTPFPSLIQGYRQFRRDLDGVKRVTVRTASRHSFRALAFLGRVGLRAEEKVPSEVIWTDSDEEKVTLARPRCNRELPEMITKRIGSYTLRNCFLTVHHGVRLIHPGPVPFDENNNLLAFALRPKPYPNPFIHVPLSSLFRSLRSGASRKWPTIPKACLLTNAWNRTYHHWVADWMPQIAILEHAGVDCEGGDLKFIIPASPAKWQLESLKLLGIPDRALVRADGPIFVEQLFVPSFARREVLEGDFSVVSPRILRWLRDRIFKHGGFDTTAPPSLKVYVSRRLALGRRVVNEHELEPALKDLGYHIAVTETMSHEDEVRLFANARIIVGAGGSGLANVVFSRGHVKMVEISGHDERCKYPDSNSYSLTAGLGHDFSVYLAKPLKRLAVARFDLRVDVPDFCKYLKQETE